ncbi:dihydrodipicolinate synthase family protein [Chelativorans sp. AA-79]|uniref:dihydrodipicolinate synthase family protein n=1 Tax=Chelativorans sp. AA-79 TaxID=3028735 RepID=UPI0023F7E2F3|nr:dihydrodipicolinate synthase family protein [Chelativorans sp. AA-79]WEX11271.1 dihydrodipicolinate synthase family protein [Chelativorans sp. AA-79]
MSTVRGVFSAAATPLNAKLEPDHAALVAHCRQLLVDGCHGIALLGSTGEANSFSVAERMDMLEAVVAGGIPAEALLPGTGLCAAPETIALTRHALGLGVTKVVMLPPFYYKGVSDAGLFDAYSRIVEDVADDRLRIILYHIPPISQVPLGHDLIARLCEKFPGTIAGVKDSGGKLDNMVSLAKSFPQLSILAGADPLLLPLLQEEGGGCITATSNLAARQLRIVFDKHADPEASAEVNAAQARIVALREASNRFVQIPTIKAMLARRYGAPAWANVRPPLVRLTEEQTGELGAILDQVDAEHPA